MNKEQQAYWTLMPPEARKARADLLERMATLWAERGDFALAERRIMQASKLRLL